jgi:hypothetical protein
MCYGQGKVRLTQLKALFYEPESNEQYNYEDARK